MGVHGMDPRSGFTTPNVLEADTDRALVAAGRRLVVVADSSKWGVIGISSIARLDEADTLVTDAGLARRRGRCRRAVRELVIARSATSRRRTGRGRTRRDVERWRRAVEPVPRPRGRGRRESRAPRRRTPGRAAAAAVGSTPAREPHRRYNPLRDEWVPRLGRADPAAVARGARSRRPAAAARPTTPPATSVPGNRRANGEVNPDYDATRSSSRTTSRRCGRTSRPTASSDGLLRAEVERGTCRVICFSPRHDLTLGGDGRPRRPRGSSTSGRTRPPSSARAYQWVQVFENRGEMMGASNPHPHGQIWAGAALPNDAVREDAASGATVRATAGRCCSTTSPRRAAGRGSSPRTRTGWPSCRSGRRGRSRCCWSRGRRRAGLPDLDDVARDALAGDPDRPARRLRPPVRAVRSRTRWAGTRRRSGGCGRGALAAPRPLLPAAAAARRSASSWSATSCSPRRSAT